MADKLPPKLVKWLERFGVTWGGLFRINPDVPFELDMYDGIGEQDCYACPTVLRSVQTDGTIIAAQEPNATGRMQGKLLVKNASYVICLMCQLPEQSGVCLTQHYGEARLFLCTVAMRADVDRVVLAKRFAQIVYGHGADETYLAALAKLPAAVKWVKARFQFERLGRLRNYAGVYWQTENSPYAFPHYARVAIFFSAKQRQQPGYDEYETHLEQLNECQPLRLLARLEEKWGWTALIKPLIKRRTGSSFRALNALDFPVFGFFMGETAVLSRADLQKLLKARGKQVRAKTPKKTPSQAAKRKGRPRSGK
ncbi:MAG: hypothetical protein HY397_03430 [Candidatus Doudnabacteria bacterium]|nr:hypothetical protein [Candidatus Doudnabacteria bacterium]